MTKSFKDFLKQKAADHSTIKANLQSSYIQFAHPIQNNNHIVDIQMEYITGNPSKTKIAIVIINPSSDIKWYIDKTGMIFVKSAVEGWLTISSGHSIEDIVGIFMDSGTPYKWIKR